MASNCSILAQRIPWTEEPGGLQSMVITESDMTEVTQYAHAYTKHISKQMFNTVLHALFPINNGT